MSGSPNLCEFETIVLARRPDFGDLRMSGRFVVLVGDVFVYYMLLCMFWVVYDLVLPLEMPWSPDLCRVLVDCVV